MEVNSFASKGVAGTALGLGAAALGVNLLNGNIGNLLGGGGKSGGCSAADVAAIMASAGAHSCSEDHCVNRYEMSMTQQLANKDMEIAYLRGQDETNKKITETYAALMAQINSLAAEVRHNKDEQNGINLNQAVFNGTTTSAISCIQGNVAQLFALTKLIVPNSSVCPGWTTTAAAAG